MFSHYQYNSNHRVIYTTACISSYVLASVWEWCCRTLRCWALVNWMIVSTSEILFIYVGWPMWKPSRERWTCWQWCQGKVIIGTLQNFFFWPTWDSSGCLNPVHCRPNRDSNVIQQSFLRRWYFAKFMLS